MLLNPFSTRLQAYPGTRVLQEDYGLLGTPIVDPRFPERAWTIVRVYGPAQGRALSGLRVKLEDAKGFVTFCNQRDLELYLGLGVPGEVCLWTGEDYPHLDSHNFYGLCADEDDLVDDLYDRELTLRAYHHGALPDMEIVRLVHVSAQKDVAERYLTLGDFDPETGQSPDQKMSNLGCRWSRVERVKTDWRQV